MKLETETHDYSYVSRVVLAALTAALLATLCASAFAQTGKEVPAQFFDLRVGYVYTCSITDGDSKVMLKSSGAKLCVDDLNMRSLHVGTNGKTVKCAIDTPVAYFEFTKVNDEPGKGRTQCIVAMQDSSKPFDQPVPKIITPKTPEQNLDKRPAILQYH